MAARLPPFTTTLPYIRMHEQSALVQARKEGSSERVGQIRGEEEKGAHDVDEVQDLVGDDDQDVHGGVAHRDQVQHLDVREIVG